MIDEASVGAVVTGVSGAGSAPRGDLPTDRSAAIVAAAVDSIVTLDGAGRVVELNPAAEVLFGWAREEAIGRELDELFLPSGYAGAHWAGMTRFAATGEGPVPDQRLELPAVRRDGTPLVVELVAVPMVHEGRRELTAFIRDITETRRTEELRPGSSLDGVTTDRHRERRLDDATAQMRTLIDHLGAAVLLEDDTRHVLVANDVLVDLFRLPLRADELVGTDGSEYADRIKGLFSDPDDFVAAVDQRVAQGIPIIGEQLSLVDGSTLERDYLPIVSADRHAGHLWVYRDITQHIAERQMLTDQNRSLAELAALKNEFVARVSHELRTPLTSVVSFAEMLRDPAIGSLTVDQAAFLEVIDRNSLRLLRLIEDLLLVARLESHTLPLSLGLVDLPDVVTQVVTELTPRARDGGVELAVTTASGPRVRGDWVRLQQVVSNLVGNAISYTLPGGTVHVTAEPLLDTGHWSIAISDTGVGIPEDEIAHVFDAFFRATSASDAVGGSTPGGTGLGLAISRLIVDEHHGRICVQSPPGAGTTVTVRLPYEEA